MASTLPADPSQVEQTYRIVLDGRAYRLTLRWSQRRIGWYLDLETDAGRALVQGRRLCPLASPLAGLVDAEAPAGILLVTGPDGYAREDLGASLLLEYVPAAEVPQPAPSPYRVTP